MLDIDLILNEPTGILEQDTKAGTLPAKPRRMVNLQVFIGVIMLQK
jgi:hypothetical protein